MADAIGGPRANNSVGFGGGAVVGVRERRHRSVGPHCSVLSAAGNCMHKREAVVDSSAESHKRSAAHCVCSRRTGQHNPPHRLLNKPPRLDCSTRTVYIILYCDGIGAERKPAIMGWHRPEARPAGRQMPRVRLLKQRANLLTNVCAVYRPYCIQVVLHFCGRREPIDRNERRPLRATMSLWWPFRDKQCLNLQLDSRSDMPIRSLITNARRPVTQFCYLINA